MNLKSTSFSLGLKGVAEPPKVIPSVDLRGRVDLKI
jgi:hypothetical protein